MKLERHVLHPLHPGENDHDTNQQHQNQLYGPMTTSTLAAPAADCRADAHASAALSSSGTRCKARASIKSASATTTTQTQQLEVHFGHPPSGQTAMLQYYYASLLKQQQQQHHMQQRHMLQEEQLQHLLLLQQQQQMLLGLGYQTASHLDAWPAVASDLQHLVVPAAAGATSPNEMKPTNPPLVSQNREFDSVNVRAL